ncbi:hypothetical protein HJFPF1_04004 [Paramyrothecium foliicola]|nr:hypothetical protein HJFPF1_04004 [Paramyrothecium foliicola]
MSSRDEYVKVSHDWVKALHDQDIGALSLTVAETVRHDGEEQGKKKYTQQIIGDLEASAVDKIELDLLIVDVSAGATAVRLIHHATLKQPYLGASVTGKAIEWASYTLNWFNASLQIIRTETLVDVDTLRANTVEAPRTPSLKLGQPPPNFDMKAMYRGYLNAINTQTTVENLHRFCQPVVTHNLQVSTLDAFRFFIEDSFIQVEGMHLRLVDLIVDEVTQQIASRIELSGKPVGVWGGTPPTGRSVQFPEHAFYTLDEGKIAYVWAVRDFDTYKKCLQG